MKQLPTSPTTEHIKSHQDTKYPNRPLTWKAFLNVAADELATTFLDTTKPSPSLVPLLPAAKILLHIKQQTITHHHNNTIHFLSQQGKYIEFLAKTHDKDPAEVANIDWKIMNALTKNVPFHQKLFGIKWRNNLLPIHKLEHKIGRIPSTECPAACGCKCKNHWHLLTCQSIPQQESWNSFHDELTDCFEKHQIDPALQRTLLLCLHSIILQSTNIKITGSYATLYKQQQTLGNQSLFLGWFSTNWTKIQQDFLHRNLRPRDKHQAYNGIKSIALLLAKQVHNIWKIQNTNLYGHNPTPAFKLALLQHQVTKYYEMTDELLCIDKSLFNMPLKEQLKLSGPNLEQFISYVKPIVCLSKQ